MHVCHRRPFLVFSEMTKFWRFSLVIRLQDRHWPYTVLYMHYAMYVFIDPLHIWTFEADSHLIPDRPRKQATQALCDGDSFIYQVNG